MGIDWEGMLGCEDGASLQNAYDKLVDDTYKPRELENDNDDYTEEYYEKLAIKETAYRVDDCYGMAEWLVGLSREQILIVRGCMRSKDYSGASDAFNTASAKLKEAASLFHNVADLLSTQYPNNIEDSYKEVTITIHEYDDASDEIIANVDKMTNNANKITATTYTNVEVANEALDFALRTVTSTIPVISNALTTAKAHLQAIPYTTAIHIGAEITDDYHKAGDAYTRASNIYSAAATACAEADVALAYVTAFQTENYEEWLLSQATMEEDIEDNNTYKEIDYEYEQRLQEEMHLEYELLKSCRDEEDGYYADEEEDYYSEEEDEEEGEYDYILNALSKSYDDEDEDDSEYDSEEYENYDGDE